MDTDKKNLGKTLVTTVTLNEVDSIGDLLLGISKYLPEADILVIDDASPDGTGRLVEKFQKSFSQLKVIHRPTKLGIGSAHKLAISFAYHQGYERLITLDADYSHNPRDLPRFEGLLTSNDFVIGSRYVEGGSCDYKGMRLGISKVANYLVRRLLSVPLYETTTSYRGFSRKLIEHLASIHLKANGYSFFFYITYIANKFSRNIAEIPIHFSDRREGKSKISKTEIIIAFFTLLKLAFQECFGASSNIEKWKTIEGGKVNPCPCCSHQDVDLYLKSHNSKDLLEGELEDTFNCTTTKHRRHPTIVKCLRCGLCYVNPMPSKELLESSYTSAKDPTYLANMSARHLTFKYNWKSIRKLFPPPARLLDVGCHCGAFLDIAKEHGYTIEGLEPSKWAAEISAKRLNVDIFQGMINQYPKSNKPFDIITAWDVLEHLSDPIDDLKQINRNLRLGGKFIFSTICIDATYTKLLGKYWPWYLDMHLLYFTQNSLANILYKSGFHIAQVRPYRHIIKFQYFLRKLEAMNIPGTSFLSSVCPKFISDLSLPFQFGDIVMVICTKTKEV